jgi:hypothetical protein
VPSRPGRGALPDTDLVRLPPYPDLPSAHALHRNSSVILTHPLSLPRTALPSCRTHLCFVRPSLTLVGVEDRRAVLPSAGVAHAAVNLAQGGMQAARLDLIHDGLAHPQAFGRAPSSPRPRQTCSRRSGLDVARRIRPVFRRVPRDPRAWRRQSIRGVHDARPLRVGRSLGPTNRRL